jgi:diguanylate cyclase (GGDEF)-like protein
LFHDALTGLPNRRLFLDRLRSAFVRSRSGEPAHALLLADVDHFKVFNEDMGTTAGDHVLVEISRRLQNELRVVDLNGPKDRSPATTETRLFRLGGDEFAILLETIGGPSDAFRVAKQMQEVVALPFTLEGREVRAALSVGIALSVAPHQRPEDLLRDADTALRRSKALGGSRCEVFDEAMHSQAIGRLKLESDLRIALAKHQFCVHYQPVVQLDTRRIISFEALLRWNHPTQGLISPYRFLQAAEDTGILISAGHWLLLQACRQLREWESAHPAGKSVGVTVNISARQFADGQLMRDLQHALQETGAEPARLQLELTESVAAADPEHTVAVLAHLKQLGIGVVLDDFGAELASIVRLRQSPVDALKIDRTLVHAMQTDRAAADIVELIVTLAHKMNLKVIAEGIETSRQVELLLELGCEYGQGYFFSQPLEPRAAKEFLASPSKSSGATAR